MTGDGREVSGVGWSAERNGERVGLRPVAAGVVAGLGAFFLVRHLVVGGGASALETALELPFVLLSLSLLYAGYWLLRCDVPLRRVGRVVACSIAGFLGLTAVAIWLVGAQGLPLQRSLLLTMDVGTVGTSTGLLVGLEGEWRIRRAGHGGRDAVLAAERAEERFAFLNRLLRHHLLNGVAVIRGHAELLEEALADPPESVGTIRRRSDELVGLVQNVETLGRVFTDDLPTRPTDPAGPIRDGVEAVRRDHPEAQVGVADLESPPVLANDRLDLAFEALLRFAVEHADDGRLSVSTAETGGAVVVSIAFDGAPPRPAISRASAGEGGPTDLGLFLAEALIEYFGGSVAVGAEEGGGVRVRLPAAG